MPSLGGSGSYGGDDVSGGASRGTGSGGGNGGNSRNDPRQGRGYNTNYSKNYSSGGGGNGGNSGGGNSTAPASRSLGSLRAELDRRDRAAVAALGQDGRNVNVASDVFNDDEEGINSISEALGRFGSWVQDRFGAGAPGGFAKSDAAGGLATLGGFLAGGRLVPVSRTLRTVPMPPHRVVRT